MRQIPLYSGNGASLSPNGEGRTLSAYVRLVADEGMILKNGERETIVVDVLATSASEWREIPDGEPLTEEEALTRYANSVTGASDPDLISAAETLIEQRIKEEE